MKRSLLRNRSFFSSLLLAMLAAFCGGGEAAAAAQQNKVSQDKNVVVQDDVPPESNNYPLTQDSKPQPGVPMGKTFKFDLSSTKIFPGTFRQITVYVPAEYQGDKPACVYVGLDYLAFNAPTVFDNLIAQHAMPVTIAIGIPAATIQSATPPENPRFDRSFEFDSLNGRVARFILEEVLPEVEKHQTPDGKPILLSHNPNDRAIGGSSTGGVASFTVAWERPDAFRRVFSAIGTFVGMRGAEDYYVLVRKTEPKPLRVFLQDGAHDEWPGGPEMGDWFMANQTMARALEFAGYDVRHVWGAGGHTGNQASSVFPDAMRWLWRDWPEAPKSGVSGNPVLQAILQPGEEWQPAAKGCIQGTRLATNARGEVFYSSGGAQKASPLADGTASQCRQTGTPEAFAFGPDGKIYAARPGGGVDAGDGGVRGDGLQIRDLTVRSTGDIYATTQTSDGHNELWQITPRGQKIRLDGGLKGASGIALTPDNLWVFVAQSLSRSGLNYRLKPDGMLDSKEPFYDFQVPAWADDSGAEGIAMDRDGRAYVATRLGVQVFDRNGRVTAILPLPGNEQAVSVSFGGQNFDTLYVSGGDMVYKRKLRVTGAPPWGSPLKLPPGSGG